MIISGIQFVPLFTTHALSRNITSMKTTPSNNFRENVLMTLQNRGMSQNQFWKNTGLGSATYFNKVMKGHSTPTLEYCEKIAACLEVPLSELLKNPKELQESP